MVDAEQFLSAHSSVTQSGGAGARAASRSLGVARPMSKRIDRSWLVFISIENFERNRCVDLFSRPDGSYGFEEFRPDVEDRGEWTPVQYYSAAIYTSKEATLAAAMQSVAWLAEDGEKPRRYDHGARRATSSTVARINHSNFG